MGDPEPHSRPSSSRPAPRGSAAYPRKRAVTACQVCRARRTKCDNRKPSCSFCLKVGAACVQSAEDLSSFDPASLKILERLDGLEQLVRSLGDAGEDAAGDEPVRKRRVLPSAVGRDEVAARTNPLDSSLVFGRQVAMGMVTPPDSKHILSWPCLRALRDDEAAGDTDDQRAGTAAAELSASPSVAVVPPGLFGALEEPRQIKVLLDNFFDYTHVKNPVLDEPATRQMVLSKAVDGLGFDWSAESCLALLICALGSVSTPFGPSPGAMPSTLAYAHAQGYFQAAQKRLGVLMASETIIAPQCFFLSGVFLMCTFQPVRAWRMFVQAVVGCQQFDFLAEPSERQINGGQDDSLQQAIYWSAWKSERELRGDLRRPDFAVNDHDSRLYPPFFPTPPSPRQLPATETAGPSREQVSWYFYLAEISLRRLSARLSAEMAAIGETQGTRRGLLEAMAAALPSWEAQAGEWQASLPPCLSLGLPAEQDDVCRFVLRGHLVNLYETMYWPFLACLLESSDSYSSGNISSSSNDDKFARLAQRSLDNHLFRLVVNKAGYRHRHHGTDPMMRSCSRSALVLLATSRISRTRVGEGHILPIRLPDDWRHEVGGVVELLEFWSAETSRYEGIRQILERGLVEEDEQLAGDTSV
ncbi:RNA polymerase II-specific transcription factor-like protein [Microdochium nivale]|nr:RNA polymerase II-specific transcription factor-like protein [Microdochium nivale]